MSRIWWHAIRLFARVCVWAYYRKLTIQGREHIPADGPVLFVVNHPNALVDAAVVLVTVPRPVSFAAKSGLFEVPVLGWMLRALGAVPVYRPRDNTGEGRRNLDMFRAFSAHFEKGGAAAIFPEGESHVDPELKAVKSGPARIVVAAETAKDFELGLKVVPLGLHYEPRHEFRGDVHVVVGEAFGVADLKDTHRREAIQTVQDRIADALRPLVVHLDDVELEPLVQGVADVYVEHRRAHPDDLEPRSRAEVTRLAATCLNYYLVTDPEAVAAAQKKLDRYRRLAGRAEVSASHLEGDAQPIRTFLRLLGHVLLMVAGFPFFVVGLLTGYLPYRVTDVLARHSSKKEGESALSFFRIIWGGLVFGVFWGGLALSVWLWSKSPGITIGFMALVVFSSYAGWTYADRFEGWRDRIVGMLPMFRSRITRVSAARNDLLQYVSGLAVRYSAETGQALLPPRKTKWYRKVPWRALTTGLLIGLIIWFVWGLFDTGVPELPDRPSHWRSLSAERARDALDDDAATLVSVLDTLDDLEADMHELMAGFDEGERRFTNIEDDRAIRQALLTYLTCRGRLFRLAWMYREPDREREAEISDQAFLVSYAAAIELCRRGMQFVRTFEGEADAVRKLNEGDPVWGLPAGTFDRVRTNLANQRIHEELANASARFNRLEASMAKPTSDPWARIWSAATTGRKVVRRLTRELWSFKWDAAVARAERTFDQGRYSASKFFSDLIAGIHIREGELAHGLITQAQVDWLRANHFQPGDIMLQRRNWALTNVFLPGFWTHAAIYTGGEDGLTSLGIADDPRVAPHLGAVARPDSGGHPRLVIEALGPGVVLTSLESSVGEADAIVVLRPQVDRNVLGECVARAMSHVGKPYDFDFDFFSTDKLVCTELVYQAYGAELPFELQDIMGRDTLPALGILEKWHAERGRDEPDLVVVCFLDAREDEGIAKEADEATLIETLERPGMTMLQEHAGSDREPKTFLGVLIGLLAVGLFVFKRRKPA